MNAMRNFGGRDLKIILPYANVTTYILDGTLNLTLEEAGSSETAMYQTTRRNLSHSNVYVSVYKMFIYRCV
jgi:hypothetical protein